MDPLYGIQTDARVNPEHTSRGIDHRKQMLTPSILPNRPHHSDY